MAMIEQVYRAVKEEPRGMSAKEIADALKIPSKGYNRNISPKMNHGMVHGCLAYLYLRGLVRMDRSTGKTLYFLGGEAC
jgi:hypothetical protein